MSRAAPPVGAAEDMVPAADATDAEQQARLKAARSARRQTAPLLPAAVTGFGAGQAGRFGGRVAWPVKVPAQWESTAAIRGLYPWLSAPAQPVVGPVWGRDAISGSLYAIDPWDGRRRGAVDDSGVWISGVIGSGKSAGAKSLVLRHTAFGRPFVVPGDIRGEWVPVARAVGGTVLKLGPGMKDRINMLAMPPRPLGIDAGAWWALVLSHWHQLLIAEAETIMPGGRELEPEERTGIELALIVAAGNPAATGGTPAPISLGPVVELLLDPTSEMAAEMRMGRVELQAALRKVGLVLRELTVGPLAGLLDSDRPENQIDPTSMATVVDLSRVRASDTALALVLSCTQSVIELAMAHRIAQWWQVYDELWRLMAFPSLLRRLNAGQRTSRQTGAGVVLITHRMSDGALGGEAGSTAVADLISDCATKILYRQRVDALAALRRFVPVTDVAAELLPTLPRGRAIHLVGDRPRLVDHIVPRRGAEWQVLETDQALEDRYRTLDEANR